MNIYKQLIYNLNIVIMVLLFCMMGCMMPQPQNPHTDIDDKLAFFLDKSKPIEEKMKKEDEMESILSILEVSHIKRIYEAWGDNKDDRHSIFFVLLWKLKKTENFYKFWLTLPPDEQMELSCFLLGEDLLRDEEYPRVIIK